MTLISIPSSVQSLESNVLLMRLGEEWFALPAIYIREIVRWREPTPVPGTSSSILGIINLRGTILPLVDPRPILGMQQRIQDRSTRLVVLEVGEYSAALLVDEVLDLFKVAEEDREPVPAGSGRFMAGLIRSERGRAILLDPVTLFETLRGM